MFTMPGVLLIIVTGVPLALMQDYPLLRTAWILWSLVLFAISGLAFSFRVAPLQKKTAGEHPRRSRGHLERSGVPRLLRAPGHSGAWSRRWRLCIAVFLMVMKPV